MAVGVPGCFPVATHIARATQRPSQLRGLPSWRGFFDVHGRFLVDAWYFTSRTPADAIHGTVCVETINVPNATRTSYWTSGEKSSAWWVHRRILAQHIKNVLNLSDISDMISDVHIIWTEQNGLDSGVNWRQSGFQAQSWRELSSTRGGSMHCAMAGVKSTRDWAQVAVSLLCSAAT